MRALVLQHIACEPPGVFAEVMRERGWITATCEIDEAGVVPEIDGFDAIIAMGGPMSVNDEEALPWLVGEKQLIGEAVRAGMPYFGACLGVAAARREPGGQGVRRAGARGRDPARRADRRGRVDPIMGSLDGRS